MNAPIRTPPPKLDPLRALYIEAIDALIDRRLGSAQDFIGGHAANRLLDQLVTNNLAQLVSLPDERRFTIRHDPARDTLYIQSLDGDIQLLPVSSDAIEIDTPLG